jgi:MFS family permease
MKVLVPLTVSSAIALPLIWLGDSGASMTGVALWGLGTGVQESLIPAAVATMVPRTRRTSAYGIFTAGYGLALFSGGVVIGLLYAVNIASIIIFGVVAELAAIPVFLWVSRKHAVLLANSRESRRSPDERR